MTNFFVAVTITVIISHHSAHFSEMSNINARKESALDISESPVGYHGLQPDGSHKNIINPILFETYSWHIALALGAGTLFCIIYLYAHWHMYNE